jgi:hypothetical protein
MIVEEIVIKTMGLYYSKVIRLSNLGPLGEQTIVKRQIYIPTDQVEDSLSHKKLACIPQFIGKQLGPNLPDLVSLARVVTKGAHQTNLLMLVLGIALRIETS